MKRTTQKVEKRTFTLKNAIPRFVSVVTRGANYTPLSQLRHSEETDRFSEVEINRIVFSKENFSREQVDAYLKENDYADYEIFEDDTLFIVPGVEADQFTEVSPIEYGDGVQFFVGKLKQATSDDQDTTAVTDAEVLDFLENADQEAEVVAESQDNAEQATVEEEATNEETVTASEEEPSEEGDEDDPEDDDEESEDEEEVVVTASEESTPVFNETVFRSKAEAALAAFFEAIEAAKTESFSVPVEVPVTYSEDDVAKKVQEAVDAAIEAYKADNNEENVENAIDETTIVVQNSQAVTTEDISTDSRDEPTEKFSNRKQNDLFGLRG